MDRADEGDHPASCELLHRSRELSLERDLMQLTRLADPIEVAGPDQGPLARRNVIAHMHQINIDPDLSVDVFVLEPVATEAAT
jgi:hypothetical protein